MKFVKYTSIGLILGFGGYACYRLILKQGLVHRAKPITYHVPTQAPFPSDPVEKKDSSTTSNGIKETVPSPSLIQEQNNEPNPIHLPSEPTLHVTSQPLETEQQLPPKIDLNEIKTEEEPEVRSNGIDQPTEVRKEILTLNGNLETVLTHIKSTTTTTSLIPDLDLMTNKDTSFNSIPESDVLNSIGIKKNDPKETSTLSTDSLSTTNCSLEVFPSTPCSSPLDVSELDGCTTTDSIDQYTTQPSFSMTSQASMIGEGMVAKLEQLLNEAGDLKESVGADLVTVRKLEPKLSLGDSLLVGDESNGDSIVTNGKDECSQTPSLEWDTNGIHLLSDPDSTHSTIKEEDESLLSESLLSEKSELFSPISSVSLSSTNEPSLFIDSFSEMHTDQSDHKEMSSLQFSTSDANENII